MLKITKPSIRCVAVITLNLKWCGPLLPGSVACGFKCTACRSKIGEGRFAGAWLRDGDEEYSARLCAACGLKAEADLVARGGTAGTLGPPE